MQGKGKVIFKETPSSSTDLAIVHWAVLTKGISIPVTDWIERPFDVENERVKTNAAINQLTQTSASADEALSLRIDQNKTGIENADRKIDSEIIYYPYFYKKINLCDFERNHVGL